MGLLAEAMCTKLQVALYHTLGDLPEPIVATDSAEEAIL